MTRPTPDEIEHAAQQILQLFIAADLELQITCETFMQNLKLEYMAAKKLAADHDFNMHLKGSNNV